MTVRPTERHSRRQCCRAGAARAIGVCARQHRHSGCAVGRRCRGTSWLSGAGPWKGYPAAVRDSELTEVTPLPPDRLLNTPASPTQVHGGTVAAHLDTPRGHHPRVCRVPHVSASWPVSLLPGPEPSADRALELGRPRRPPGPIRCVTDGPFLHPVPKSASRGSCLGCTAGALCTDCARTSEQRPAGVGIQRHVPTGDRASDQRKCDRRPDHPTSANTPAHHLKIGGCRSLSSVIRLPSAAALLVTT
jgi:hypothetical protein